MQVKLIYARSQNGVIGKDNKIPWKSPLDMQRFKTLTEGHAVLMGRQTWMSIPQKFRPLPNRFNMVLSRDREWTAGYYSDGVATVRSFEEAMLWIAPGRTLWVIGGESVYAEALAHADTIEETVICKDYEGDRFAPYVSDWEVSRLEELVEPLGEQLRIQFRTLVRKKEAAVAHHPV